MVTLLADVLNPTANENRLAGLIDDCFLLRAIDRKFYKFASRAWQTRPASFEHRPLERTVTIFTIALSFESKYVFLLITERNGKIFIFIENVFVPTVI